MDLTVGDDGVEVTLDATQEPARFSWRWLRDHGEDPSSRDPETLQRRTDTFSIDPMVRGVVDVDSEGEQVTVAWPDGAETTHSYRQLAAVAAEFHAADWLRPIEYKPRVPGVDDGVELWSDPAAALNANNQPGEVDLQRFLHDDTVLADGVELLCRYGYLVLRGDEAERDRAAAFVDRLGYIRQTIFGAMWDLAPDLDEHADTAYTSVYLAPHTDATYSHDAPGLQFFLCLQPAASGGESLLVDGFAIADELSKSELDTYVALASIPVPGRYIEPGVHLRAERPVFRTNPRGVLDQVSFNNYDRAPFLLPADLEDRFYSAYGRFAELANDPGRRIEISLTVGDILVFDNWRVLHGRNAFGGARHYLGGYLNHEDLESKRRVLTA